MVLSQGPVLDEIKSLLGKYGRDEMFIYQIISCFLLGLPLDFTSYPSWSLIYPQWNHKQWHVGPSNIYPCACLAIETLPCVTLHSLIFPSLWLKENMSESREGKAMMWKEPKNVLLGKPTKQEQSHWTVMCDGNKLLWCSVPELRLVHYSSEPTLIHETIVDYHQQGQDLYNQGYLQRVEKYSTL